MTRAMLWLAVAAAGLVGGDAGAQHYAAAPPMQNDAPASEGAAGPIAGLQQLLKREGFAPGPVNGVMTEQTRRALEQYERRHGRTLSGAEGDPVRRVQAALQRRGMFDGPVDGVVGPATRDAIIRFEASRKIAVDPRVSDALLAALEDAGATSRPAPPAATQAPPAQVSPPAQASPPAQPSPPASAMQNAPEAAPPRPAPQKAPAPAAAATQAPPAEATGRRPLPAWVNPPPIR